MARRKPKHVSDLEFPLFNLTIPLMLTVEDQFQVVVGGETYTHPQSDEVKRWAKAHVEAMFDLDWAHVLGVSLTRRSGVRLKLEVFFIARVDDKMYLRSPENADTKEKKAAWARPFLPRKSPFPLPQIIQDDNWADGETRIWLPYSDRLYKELSALQANLIRLTDHMVSEMVDLSAVVAMNALVEGYFLLEDAAHEPGPDA